MNFATIKKRDIADGPGVRVSLFVSGCTHRCEGCFNEIAWDFDYGAPFTEAVEEELLEALAPDYVAGLTLLGGEPFEPKNQEVLLPFVKKVRERFPHKTIWSFSGFTWEELHDEDAYCHCEVTEELIGLLDVLVDGRFVEALKDISLRFRGSSNQRIIDVKATLTAGEIVLWNK